MKIEFTNDEAYQLIKLYDLVRDTDMIDDLPKEIESAFDKIQDEQVNYQRKVEKAQAKQKRKDKAKGDGKPQNPGQTNRTIQHQDNT